jgi:hypothetical protein
LINRVKNQELRAITELLRAAARLRPDIQIWHGIVTVTWAGRAKGIGRDLWDETAT